MCYALGKLTEFRSAHAGIKGGWPGQMRCSNMVADSKTEKNLGHNLTVTRLVSLPKTRLRTTTGHYIVKYTLRDRSRCVSRVLRSIEL